MKYTEVTFKINPVEPARSLLVDALGNDGAFDSFADTPDGLKAYVPAADFVRSDVDDAIGRIKSLSDECAAIKCSYTVEEMPDKDWNEEWERNHKPILEKCWDHTVYVRAPFHEHRDDVDYEIVIEPKMSFGTAHHPTTRLMIDHLIEEMPVGKRVLDMGTGTGVLAILAKKLGASHVEAVDIDEWSYRNAVENAALNGVDINVRLGDATTLDGSFDMVLANINKNILMRDMPEYNKVLKPGGVLIISGFYEQDRTQMDAYARSLGLTPTLSMTCDDWCSINIFKASDK